MPNYGLCGIHIQCQVCGKRRIERYMYPSMCASGWEKKKKANHKTCNLNHGSTRKEGGEQEEREGYYPTKESKEKKKGMKRKRKEMSYTYNHPITLP